MAGFLQRILFKFPLMTQRNPTDHQSQMQELIKDAFDVFFGRHISSYERFQSYQLSAVGSIAFVFKNQLEEVAKKYSVNVNKIIQKPMEGLIFYHLQTT